MTVNTPRTTGWVAPKDHYAVPVLFNPYTGEPRDVRDVQSDPQGVLIVPPGSVHVLAAKATTTAYDSHQRVEHLLTQESELRRALEIIALGEAPDPVIDAGDELVTLGYWDADSLAAARAAKQMPAVPGTASAHWRHADPLSTFQEGQWWVLELDKIWGAREATVAVTHDLKRAVATVHHMLRAARDAEALQALQKPAVVPTGWLATWGAGDSEHHAYSHGIEKPCYESQPRLLRPVHVGT